MLDDIMEIILEIIWDGLVETTGSKKVPMPLRIALGAVLALFPLGICALLFVAGVHSGSIPLIVLSIVLLICTVVFAASKIKDFKNRR